MQLTALANSAPSKRGRNLNGLNPRHYLADVLARIADHPARRIAELLPWSWQPLDANRAAA